MVKLYLYEKDETSFTSMGICNLVDAASCEVTEELNGGYELEMEYPIDGQYYSEIKEERIILCPPNSASMSRLQPFRIYSIEKEVEGVITVNARHIHFDMCNIATKARSSTSTLNTLSAAISELNDNIIASNQKNLFTYSTSGTFETAEYTGLDTPNTLSGLIFDDSDASLVNVFGAELYYNKFSCIFYKKRGSDRGLKIQYSKNMLSMTNTVNADKCYTGMMPYFSQDVQQSSSTTKKEYKKVYIVPNTTPYKYGWLSLKSNYSERFNNRIDAYTDNSLYLITKDSTDVGHESATSIDSYVNKLVMQTGLITKGCYWKKCTKSDLPAGTYPVKFHERTNLPVRHGEAEYDTAHNVTIVSSATPYGECWFSRKSYSTQGDWDYVKMLDYEENTGDIGINEHVYAEFAGIQPDQDAKYVGFYYQAVLNWQGVPGTSAESPDQWTNNYDGTPMQAMYALKNVYGTDTQPKESPTISDACFSPDNEHPFTGSGEYPVTQNVLYVVVNQYVNQADTDGNTVDKFFQNCYYYRSTGSKFAKDPGLISALISKIKTFTNSTTNTVHKVFYNIDTTTQLPTPIYFTETGHSASDAYQKIAMIDVSSELSETPISDADFTQKISSWVTEHKKDYMYNDVKIDTSFILGSSFSAIQSVSLGDTVTIVHEDFGVYDVQRVASLTYDVLKDMVVEVTLQKEEEE